MDIAILSPVSPLEPLDGHRMAILSDVQAMVDNGLKVGVIAFTYDDRTPARPTSWTTVPIPARPGNFGVRLARGLLTRMPPSAERLYGAEARRTVRQKLAEWRPAVVMIDDASVGGYIPAIREVLPNAKVVLRSHNVMHDVRREQLARTFGPLKPVVKFDCERYLALEKRVVETCDRHWAITPSDAARMTELYHRPAQHLTVSLALERYQSVGFGAAPGNGFVHVGSLDFRRQSDLKMFLDLSWPKVLRTDPASTLTIAGKLHSSQIAAHNVRYLGRVENDAEVYGLGRFAVNFQLSTGGVKLKTLTSLAAGRVLLSTRQGVEGLPLTSGVHYWDTDAVLSNGHLKEILDEVRVAQKVAEAGRQYVGEHHSRAAVARQAGRLLNDL